MPETNIDPKSKRLFFKTIQEVDCDELEDLITSLLSSAEIKDISRRIMAAKLLKEGKTYQEIIEIMGMSESTVNKIHFKTKGSPTINELFR